LALYVVNKGELTMVYYDIIQVLLLVYMGICAAILNFWMASKVIDACTRLWDRVHEPDGEPKFYE